MPAQVDGIGTTTEGVSTMNRCHDYCETVDGWHVHVDTDQRTGRRRVYWAADWAGLLAAVKAGDVPRMTCQAHDVGPFGWHDVVTVEDAPLACDECGGPVDALDGWTDGTVVLCGVLRGNGCCRVMEGVTW